MKADDEALKLYSRFCDYLKNISRESTFHYDTFWPTYNAHFEFVLVEICSNGFCKCFFAASVTNY